MRRTLAVAFAAAVTASVMTATLPSAATAAPAPQAAEAAAVPDQLLVGYVDRASPSERQRARGRAGAQREEQVVAPGRDRNEVELVRLPRGKNRDQAIRELESDPAVDYAEPNWIYTTQASSNDPYYTNGSLWGMYGDATSPANQYGSQAGEA